MLNLHFKEFFSDKSVLFKEKEALIYSFFILIYTYNFLNISNKNKVCKLSILGHA